MRLPRSIPQARTNILQQGIQQTNRYAVSYSGDNDLKYPYAITLPGYGYDLIDHSIWSINRKIPFRKSQTDVELTFIVGNTNYLDYVYYWNNLISSPKNNNTVMKDPGASANFAASNGIAQSEMENQGGPSVESTPEDDSEYSGVSVLGNPLTPPSNFGSPNLGPNLLNAQLQGIINGQGGAASYMNSIYNNTLTVYLLDEQHYTRNTFVFEEAYISQISPVQLTSTETGYSPFKVSFRFATMRTIL